MGDRGKRKTWVGTVYTLSAFGAMEWNLRKRGEVDRHGKLLDNA